MRIFLPAAIILLIFNSCNKKSGVFSGKLTYEVQCSDKEVEEMVHKYFGKVFELWIADSSAVLNREWNMGHVTHLFQKGSMLYKEEVEDRCIQTRLTGDLLEYFRMNSMPDSIVYLDEKDEWMGFTTQKALVYDALSLPEGPAEAWYCADIPNYWPYLPDMKGMFVKYRYTMRGIPVDYVLTNVSDDILLPKVNVVECDYLFPEVFVINPEQGSPYVNDYHVLGKLKLEELNNPLAYANIRILRNDSLYYEASTDSIGYYSFYLPLGNSYDLTYEADSFVSKTVRIDTRNIPDSAVTGGFETHLDMSLFYDEGNEAVRNYLKKPIGISFFDASTNSFIFDFDYTDRFVDSLNVLRGIKGSKAK